MPRAMPSLYTQPRPTNSDDEAISKKKLTAMMAIDAGSIVLL